LISPDYNLEEFCLQMIGKDYRAVIDAAGAEASYDLGIHRHTTKEDDFPEASLGREYRENLRRLVSLLVNGSIPPDATPYFLSAVKPLISQLLEKWEIGSLRRFLPLINDLLPIDAEKATMGTLNIWDLPGDVDPFGVIVSRDEVETLDTGPSLSILRQLTASPATARRFFERVDIAFHGYDDTTQELFETVEVRDFIYKLDEQFPFWLFFLSKHYLALQCLLLCFLPPFLTEEGRSEIFPERIERLLTKHWFPAMNHICEYAGFSEEDIERLSDRVLAYIASGPLQESEPHGVPHKTCRPVTARFEGDSATPFAPDYGLFLLSEGCSRDVGLIFCDFPFHYIGVLGLGRFTTTRNLVRGGVEHAVSLDFGTEVLAEILALSPESVVNCVMTVMKAEPAGLSRVELPEPLSVGLEAYLGELQIGDGEKFVPLVIKRIFSVSRLTASTHPRSSAPARKVPSRLSATEVLSRVQVLRDGNAQWDEILSELNPTGDRDVQQLLMAIRGPHMFGPHLGLGVIEDGCKRVLALSANADALDALREAARRQEPFVE
jgi:hypothetical protein